MYTYVCYVAQECGSVVNSIHKVFIEYTIYTNTHPRTPLLPLSPFSFSTILTRISSPSPLLLLNSPVSPSPSSVAP